MAARCDVFNGDADGICALHQLRLAQPAESLLVTGVKRDIALLQRVPRTAGLDVTVLDISLDSNAEALAALLAAGASVRYFDHHAARRACAHPRLQLHWDDAPEVCTSVLVDRHLGGRYRSWAAVAAFGDNLAGPARQLAAQAGLGAADTGALERLGVLLNYNAYGEHVADLHIAPDALYRAVRPYAAPLDFIADAPEYRLLDHGYRADAARMDGLQPAWAEACGAVYLLPAMPWARRISGVFANRLMSAGKAQSCAVLTANADGSYVVSVRSGAPAAHAASDLCERYAGGGGRRAAAGINRLPAAELDDFMRAFSNYFGAPGTAN